MLKQITAQWQTLVTKRGGTQYQVRRVSHSQIEGRYVREGEEGRPFALNDETLRLWWRMSRSGLYDNQTEGTADGK